MELHLPIRWKALGKDLTFRKQFHKNHVMNSKIYFYTFLSLIISLSACTNQNSRSDNDEGNSGQEQKRDLYEDYNNSNQNNSTTDNNTQTARPRQKTEDELREELYHKELRKPKEYLTVTYDLTYRVFSGKDEIKGTIYNNANFASFKDVVLTVAYFSATDTEIDRETYTIYDYVYAGSSSDFVIKTYSPQGTKKIGVYIKSASGI